MAKSAPNNLAHIHRDRGYRFVDRDPVMEEVAGAITRSGRSLEWLSKRSGVSASTLANWMSGKTRRPQHLTVSFVMSSLGYQETWTEVGQVEDTPVEQVRPMSFADAFPRITVDRYDQFLRPQTATADKTKRKAK